MSAPDFYRSFEDRYRGTRELIKKRLEVYVSFIKPFLRLYDSASVIDLGCGRGEWLELLQEQGFRAVGIDLDEAMLRDCQALNLVVEQGDAIAFLEQLEDESQAIVSAFHLVEHIEFESLQALIGTALRVLKPGGLLIMETPNPENIVVATQNFYLDPTHRKPIPPPLLAFLAEYHGFKRIKTLRLQESTGLQQEGMTGLQDVLEGVSPDYAIIAQKQADAQILQEFDAAFKAEYGISLEQLTHRYDSKVEQRLSSFDERIVHLEARTLGLSDALERLTVLQERLLETTVRAERAEGIVARQNEELDQTRQRAVNAETRAIELEQRAAEADARTDKLEQRANTLEIKVTELNACSHHWWQQADHLSRQVQIYANSRSWRYTYPLRATKAALTGSVTPLTAWLGKAVRYPMAFAMKIVLQCPRLAHKINQSLLRYPKLRNRLLSMARRSGIWQGQTAYRAHVSVANQTQSHNFPTLENSAALSQLTPRARRIYHDLQNALGDCRRKNG